MIHAETLCHSGLRLVLLVLLGSLCTARAYYDPGVQRWLNRDPIQEQGGINFYRVVQNDPITKVDAFGLIAPGEGPERVPGGPGKGKTFLWFDQFIRPGPPGSKCLFACHVIGFGPGTQSNQTKLKDCTGLARARLRKAAGANDLDAWDKACEELKDCHKKYE
jgi:hypothetical protein